MFYSKTKATDFPSALTIGVEHMPYGSNPMLYGFVSSMNLYGHDQIDFEIPYFGKPGLMITRSWQLVGKHLAAAMRTFAHHTPQLKSPHEQEFKTSPPDCNGSAISKRR